MDEILKSKNPPALSGLSSGSKTGEPTPPSQPIQPPTQIKTAPIQPQQLGQKTPTPPPPVNPLHPPESLRQLTNPPPKPPNFANLSTLWIALILFIIGVISGILLFVTFPKQTDKAQSPTPTPTLTEETKEISLPQDAIKFQDCVDNKGALYAIPQDTQGLNYMVYQDKVIGLEYEIDQEELTQGKISKDLSALNIEINHITTGFLTNTDPDDSTPLRSYIDVYLVDTQTEEAIICEKPAEPSPEASPSAKPTEITTTPTTSPSSALSPTATPSPSPNE